MASSKMSARQKMINMMYLVLTAMLALNVSAEILQAFETLRSSLENTAASHGAHNLSLAEDIINTIESQEKNQNFKNTYVKTIIQDIDKETNEMMNYLGSLTTQLEEFGQKDAATGELEKKDEVDRNYRFWLGEDDLANSGRGNGKALELRTKLDEFVAWANALYGRYDDDSTSDISSEFQSLVIEPSEDPTITDPASRNKTWEYHTFHGKPVIADMAMIEKFKMDVRDVQAGLLNLSKSLVQGFIFTVDSLIAFEAPSSRIVAAGMKFETTIGVGVASKSIKPEFMGNGLSLNPGGSTAKMTITANGNVIPEGKNEGIQHYTAMIKVPKADGTFEEIPVRGEFTVRKPEVVVRSKALQLLYKDCGNQVIVDVPALGDLYNPDFSRSRGGRVVPNASNRKELTIIPNRPKFDLSVYTKTNGQNVMLDKLRYNVVPAPKPQIQLFVRGQRYKQGGAIPKRGKVKIKLVPDEKFAALLPKDARYKAQKVKLLMQDGITKPRVIREYNGAQIQRGIEINLYQGALRQAYDGTRIFFQVEGLKRVNYEGKAVDTGLDIYSLVIPAVVKG